MLLAAAIAVAGAPVALADIGPLKVAAPTCPAPLACGDDLTAAIDRENLAVDHLRYGKMVPIDFGTTDRIPGDVVGTGGWGDSGLWTGVYLGGESFRYATAKHALATGKLKKDESDFWTAQKAEALARIKVMVDAQHRDVNIAEQWTTETKVPPTVNPADGTHPVDFGGGIIKGEKGMLVRACTPTDAPPGLGIGQNPRVFGPWRWTDGKDYICETAPSRDTYAGVTFGLLTAFDLVAADVPGMRDLIRDDVLAMGDFLVKYGWNYPRPHGYVSPQHDFDGFVSPLFVYVPMARLNMANAARHVADVAGDTTQKLRWDAIWAEELATEGPQLGPSLEIDSLQPNDGYYKYNLHHLNAFNLMRTTSGAERQLVASAFSVMDKTTGDDLNAHFEAITYAMTGDQSRLDAAVTHLREWREYKRYIETGAQRVNSTRCDNGLDCVPEDQYDMSVAGQDVTWFPGAPDTPPISEQARLRAARPLPVELRAPTDFLWQRPPTQLDGGEAANHREPGIDYLTPYWMLRYYTEVSPPAPRPLPVWVGPSHM